MSETHDIYERQKIQRTREHVSFRSIKEKFKKSKFYKVMYKEEE